MVIVGAGMIAAVHRRSAQLAGAEIVGVLASAPERSDTVAGEWGVRSLHSIDDLSVISPDVVHICSPNGAHVEHTEAALRAGAHVICEKPLSIDAGQASRLTALASSLGRVATVPFVYRFHPLVREIRARAAAGDFGTWQLLHGSYLQDWLLSPSSTSWRVDSAHGGPSRAFADIGSHWCDLMEFVTGERISSVRADMTTTVPERLRPGSLESMPVDTEDAASVTFRTVSGVLGSVTVSQVAAGRKNRLWFEFDGSNQSAVFDQENPETVWLGTGRYAQIIHRDPHLGSSEQRRLSTLPAGHPQGYAHCFDAFVSDTYAAIGGEMREGLPTFADGLRSARVVDAVIESARNGVQVTVQDTG